MTIKDGYISKKVTFDTQDSLDEKIDRLTSMMSKWQIKMTTKISNLSLRYIKAITEDKQEISKIEIMIREIIKTDMGQIVEIGEYCLVVENNMDRITETY